MTSCCKRPTEYNEGLLITSHSSSDTKTINDTSMRVLRRYIYPGYQKSSFSPGVRSIKMLKCWSFMALCSSLLQLCHLIPSPPKRKKPRHNGKIQLALGKELSFPFEIADWLSLMANFEECSLGIMRNMF